MIYKMKAVFVCFLLAFVQAGFCAVVEISDDEATKACLAELKIDESTITTLDAVEDFDDSTPNCGKLLSCTWRKLGLQDDNGNIEFDKLKKYLANYTQKRVEAELSSTAASEATVGEWIEKCRSLRGADDEQTALKVHFCIGKSIKKFVNQHP